MPPRAAPSSTEPLSTPHTVTVLLLFSACVGYAAFYTRASSPVDGALPGQVRNGLLAAAAVALTFCAEHLRDTLFVRPHPALWRAVTGVGLLYAMGAAFLLFQDVDTARTLMTALDPSLTGRPPPHRSYGDACELTPANLWAAMDIFVVAHSVGWIFHQLMLRDIGMCMVLSFLFELMCVRGSATATARER